jgi:hypothetical protein
MPVRSLEQIKKRPMQKDLILKEMPKT